MLVLISGENIYSHKFSSSPQKGGNFLFISQFNFHSYNHILVYKDYIGWVLARDLFIQSLMFC